MSSEISILTLLRIIKDHANRSPKSMPVIVDIDEVIETGLSQDDACSIIALLQDDARCLRVIKWPVRKYQSRFVNTAIKTVLLFRQQPIRTRHSFSMEILPRFDKVLDEYELKVGTSKPAPRPSKPVKKAGAFTLHEDGTISCNGTALLLEPKQRAFAKILMEKHPYTATYDEIIEVYWNEDTDANYLDNAERDELLKNIHASKNTLLKALKSQGVKVNIENVRGSGYKFLA